MSWTARLRLVAALAALAAGPTLQPLRAQADLEIRHTVDEIDLVRVGIDVFAGSGTGGGYGFMLVRVVNLDSASHAVRVEIGTRQHLRSSVGLRRTLALGPNEAALLHLPLPVLPRYTFDVATTVDGSIYEDYLGAGRDSGPAALFLREGSDLDPEMLGLVQELWPGTRRNKGRVISCLPDEAPRDWRLYTAFPLVVVDGGSPIDGERQAALRRFANAGGSLLVLGADRLPAGELRQRYGALPGGQQERTGFGLVTVASRRLDVERLAPRLRGSGGGAPGGLGRGAGIWPLEDGLRSKQEIPGLDQAPVLVFLLVILLFAILVGPVNLFMLRRAKRPMLALVTVPAIGLGTTALMFGYAIVHDGFSVRGVERSWSVLDQAQREVATVATRTLFAGLSPPDLTLGPDSMLLAPASYVRPDQRSRHRWAFDGDRSMISGSVVPARTPTVLVSARQGISRARLRARLLPGGDLELLTDGGVDPVGGVLLRDDDGGLWYGDGPRLSRIGESDAADWLRQLRDDVLNHVGMDNGWMSFELESFAPLLARSTLPLGTYVTHVANAPWVPDHGLQPEYEKRRHFVFGRLGPEDITR